MNLLFDAPLIAGLRYAEDVVSKSEERALLERLGGLELPPFRFHGWLGNRKTQSFVPGEPIPDWLQPIRARAASFAGLQPDNFVHVLLARYDPGAGIGWHRDRDVFEKVVGISLNTSATLRFRQRAGSRFRRASLEVEPRSAYLLSGEARHDWEHSISPGQSLRFSITFRTLSEMGRRIAAAQV